MELDSAPACISAVCTRDMQQASQAPLATTPEPFETASSECDSETAEVIFDKDQQDCIFADRAVVYKCCKGKRDLPAILAAYSTAFIGRIGAADSVTGYAKELIAQESLQDTFYVLDLGVVARLFHAWVQAMPRVQPFYAVKCHPNPAMLEVLDSLGAGFDCASAKEIDTVLGLGVSPDSIVYAHPHKLFLCMWVTLQAHKALQTASMPSAPQILQQPVPAQPPIPSLSPQATSTHHPRSQLGVSLTSFDTESELRKMSALFPDARLLLRVRADDPNARCCLGNKYGAELEDACSLLLLARQLGLQVVGVSFHVGSGATNPDAFQAAIAAARAVFDIGAGLGFGMHVLDIGGGFCAGTLFSGGVATAVNRALAAHFPPKMGVRIIAEPGRYFAEAAATLFCCVNGYRCRVGPGGAPEMDYWASDGIYGNFNGILYDKAAPSVRPLRSPALPEVPAGEDRWACASTVFGPTCDGLDVVLKDSVLPLLRVGDWLEFPAMGAYSIAGAVDFNGFNAAHVPFYYVYSD